MHSDPAHLIPEPTDPLTPIDGPELVFGIVGPTGTDKDQVVDTLKEHLQSFRYNAHQIRMSNILHKLPGLKWLSELDSGEVKRITAHMNAGTKVREITKRGDALACFAVAEIQQVRASLNSPPSPTPTASNGSTPDNGQVGIDSDTDEATDAPAVPRTAYLLDSLKHSEEIASLRAIYGQAFMVISVYTDKETRVKNLARKIAHSCIQSHKHDAYDAQARELIRTDEKEEGTEYGQEVRSAFPKADFFVDASNPARCRKEIKRFLDLVFANPFQTPSIDEQGMFFAEASSWRSADLARQVGAAIVSNAGEILGTGFNETPKPFGGYNWSGDDPDFRDFHLGEDLGTRQRNSMVAEIIKRLSESDLVAPEKREEAKEMASRVSQGENPEFLSDAQALNVIEYGRSVHAEMAAICDAASRGAPIRGAQLFVNTFPCHICAKHILAAGIRRVVYVQPYPKSMTTTLYEDQITTSGTEKSSEKVPFEPFSGVAPRQYRFLFQINGERKEKNGKISRWNESNAETKLKRFVLSYMAIEQTVLGRLLEHIYETLEKKRDELCALEAEGE